MSVLQSFAIAFQNMTNVSWEKNVIVCDANDDAFR